MDIILVYLIKGICSALLMLPDSARIKLISSFLKIYFFLTPKNKQIALKNIEIAFPDTDLAWRERVITSSYYSLARLISDFLRMPYVDARWVKSNLRGEFESIIKSIKVRYPNKGIIYATGHLGSFELLAHAAAVLGLPLSFVVRNSNLPNVDKWWRGLREANGNKVIDRKGAIDGVVKNLREGIDVGVLFDQNVRVKHAVFVKWFGKLAATTKLVALAAIKTEAPVVVISAVYTGDEQYQFLIDELDFTELYSDRELSLEKKIEIITQQVSDRYVDMIRKYPEQWFWMHRRWRTRPSGESEIYNRAFP